MKPKRPKNTKTRKRAVKAGFRSGFEQKIAEDLDARGIKYKYEPKAIEYRVYVRTATCDECGSKSVSRRARYTTDFSSDVFGNVEAKGRFTSRDRTKMAAIAKQKGVQFFRILFQADNWTTSKRTERYTDWCKRQGIDCAVGHRVPESWCK